MEYEILGIPEDSSVQNAKRAINKIRLTYHPDKLRDASAQEQEKSASFLVLAEKAYKRIKQKKIVDDSIASVLTNTNDPFRMHGFANWMPDFEAMQNGQVHSSSYTYSNVNGKVNEHGTVNGRRMTPEEMKQYKQNPFPAMFSTNKFLLG